MFFFLFFYTVAYLSGVSACTKLLVAEETAEKIVGGILLPFYVLVPLWKLRGGAASVKAAVEEAASEEGHTYKEIKDEWDDDDIYIFEYKIVTTGTKVIGGGEVSTYQDSLGIFSKKAVESKINEVTPKKGKETWHASPRWEQRLTRDSPGYKASVTAVLIAPYEEEFWWWKFALMLEKALLAIIVLSQF
ncbi:hypothetical protein TrVE_jg10549 [Triparma verrucosa]|uniref:Uncharacterized protein n=1 Tax=Triparma verrucosa TaxID=1606542 RepID=A0A9W7FFP2_9STRA|nr:hypothetical protein TrVE_jg10549 [Triparma verrucosa]